MTCCFTLLEDDIITSIWWRIRIHGGESGFMVENQDAGGELPSHGGDTSTIHRGTMCIVL